MTEQSEGWHVGDLAVCIECGLWSGNETLAIDPTPGPQFDAVVRVTGIWPQLRFPGHTGIGLEFAEFPDETYPARCFRRIDRGHRAADNVDIIALIKGARVGAGA